MPAKLRRGPWRLTDLAEVPSNGLKVFSCFHCGGGSTMGYKLAGYEVLGGVEIDPEMARLYAANHAPRLPYVMGVAEFNKIPDADLPPELFNLDVLDGSPPCSSFSMAGSRDKKWGEASKFREGQVEQVLDDLFFHFIDTAAKLKPKVVVAENVKGLITGKARGYVKEIFQAFRKAGYGAQLYLLDSAYMGVPQKRERTFFIANRLGRRIDLMFNEAPISIAQAVADCPRPNVDQEKIHLHEATLPYWGRAPLGKALALVHPKGNFFNYIKVDPDKPLPTITANSHVLMHGVESRRISRMEFIRGQTFPDDYQFASGETHAVRYVCGMSVPPYMVQRVALEIEAQLLTDRWAESKAAQEEALRL